MASSTTDPATNGPDDKLEAEPFLDAPPTTDASAAAAAPDAESKPSEVPRDAPVAEVEEEENAEVPDEGGADEVAESRKWPGWPGFSVFRMIVPVLKVGSIIGRKGELIKKMCEDTRSKIRILEGAIGTTERIVSGVALFLTMLNSSIVEEVNLQVLVTGKEEPGAEISAAMHGVIRVFKRITGISDSEGDGTAPAGQSVCSVRLLVASTQAISLIGKGGALIKSIQEASSATIRVLQGEELPFYASSDERIVDIQGEPLKVLKALELVVGQLRKFLVDQSVIPLFEKNLSSSSQSVAQDRVVDKTQSSMHVTTNSGIPNDYPSSLKRDPLYFDRDSHLDSHVQRTGLSLYGQDPALAGHRSTGLGRSAGALVTQITQTMQIPLSYAEDIIGIGGANIAYIRRTSGAVLTVQESKGLPDEITVEIKGTSTQVQAAQQLIQDFLAGHKEPAGSGFGSSLESSYMSSYSQLGGTSYSSSSLPSQYGSSGGLGGYGGYRY